MRITYTVGLVWTGVVYVYIPSMRAWILDYFFFVVFLRHVNFIYFLFYF